MIFWDVHLPNNSHHQDHCFFLVRNPYEHSFAIVGSTDLNKLFVKMRIFFQSFWGNKNKTCLKPLPRKWREPFLGRNFCFVAPIFDSRAVSMCQSHELKVPESERLENIYISANGPHVLRKGFWRVTDPSNFSQTDRTHSRINQLYELERIYPNQIVFWRQKQCASFWWWFQRYTTNIINMMLCTFPTSTPGSK